MICPENLDEIECLFLLTKKTMMTVGLNVAQNAMIYITIQKRKMSPEDSVIVGFNLRPAGKESWIATICRALQ
jgi:hypothetical protein